jgi:amidase
MKFREYSRYDATGLAQLVKSGQTSLEELAETALAAIDFINPKVNAIVAKLPAWNVAFSAQPKGGAFYGVPFLIKDLFIRAKDVPCDMGSKLVRDKFVAPFDSDVMKRFRAAGLNTLARTATPEHHY